MVASIKSSWETYEHKKVYKNQVTKTTSGSRFTKVKNVIIFWTLLEGKTVIEEIGEFQPRIRKNMPCKER